MAEEITIGYLKEPYLSKSLKTTLEITLEQKAKGLCFSISGNVWNTKHTDIVQGGQMQDTIRKALNNTCPHNRYNHPIKSEEAYFKTLTIPKDKLLKILDIWDRWHLNDLKAGCEHQRAAKWEEIKLDDSKPWSQENSAMWTHKKDNPKGLLNEPCPVCGYKYGSAWLFEVIPNDVVQFIKEFAGDALNTSKF